MAIGRPLGQRRLAEDIPVQQKAEVIGLAPMLWGDTAWPQRVQKGREGEIMHGDPDCDTCMPLVKRGKPVFCIRWPFGKMQTWKAQFVQLDSMEGERKTNPKHFYKGQVSQRQDALPDMNIFLW